MSAGMKIRTLEICWISSGSMGTISMTPDEGSFCKEKSKIVIKKHSFKSHLEIQGVFDIRRNWFGAK